MPWICLPTHELFQGALQSSVVYSLSAAEKLRFDSGDQDHDHDRYPVRWQQQRVRRQRWQGLRSALLRGRRRIAVNLDIALAAAPVQQRVGTARSRLATHRTSELQRARG